MPAYGDGLPTDSGSKKFLGVLSDNGGANDFVAIKGANRATQNAEVVADMAVASTAEGATTDAAVITDADGTLSAKLRGLVKWAFERMPASLGQKAMAASLPVVLASDQSGFPASLGQKAMAASFPVVFASDQGGLEVAYTWGTASGGATSRYGDVSDWRASRSSYAVGDLLADDATVQEFFDGDDAAFDGSEIYIAIPIGLGGYRNFLVDITNNLGVVLAIGVYAVPFMQGPSLPYDPFSAIPSNVLIHSGNVADAASLTVGPAGTTITVQTQWPVGVLVVKADPASDPGAGTSWHLSVRRLS